MAIKINNDGTTIKQGNAPAPEIRQYHIYIIQDDTTTKFFITSEQYHLSRMRAKAKQLHFNSPTIELAHTLQGTLSEAKKIKNKIEELFVATEEAVNECLNLSAQ